MSMRLMQRGCLCEQIKQVNQELVLSANCPLFLLQVEIILGSRTTFTAYTMTQGKGGINEVKVSCEKGLCYGKILRTRVNLH